MNPFFDYFAQHFYQFLFVFLRVGSFFLAFPFVSAPFVPLSVRVVLTLAFSFFLAGAVPVELPSDLNALSFLLLALKELLLGFSLALIALIFYSAVIYAADLISYLMGLTVANLFDPTFGTVSVLGRFFVYVFYGVFFASGAYRLFLAALIKSFQLVPVGSFRLSGESFGFLFKEASLLFSLGFQLSFPFLLVLFVVNLALALVNRLIPQINVFIVGLPLQLFVGLLILVLGFSVVVFFTQSLVQRFLEDLFTFLRLSGG
jgi:flagellar biosynthetic protein FliR